MNKLMNVLYIGRILHGHMGEDAQFRLFRRMFYESIDREHMLGEININGFMPDKKYKRNFSFYDLVVLGGGSFLNSDYWLDIIEEVQKNNIPTVLWGVTFEGFITCKEDLIDFNKFYHDISREKLSRVISEMRYVSVLGGYTKELLANSGLDFSNVVNVIGEPLLMYEQQSKTNAGVVQKSVLVNWGRPVSVPGVEWDLVEEQMETIIQILINKGYHVTVYPVSTGDIEPIIRLREKFTENNITAISMVCDVNDVMSLIKDSLFTINYKYYATVLSAAVNRPFICLSDALDCLDFAGTVDSNDMIMSITNLNAGQVLERITAIENNHDKLTERFRKAKEKYYKEINNGIRIMHEIIAQ